MNFTNPLLLYGLFALSIPVIVHLFNFRKAKKVYFSNTQFLKQVKETSSAKRRLKHLLVLASRLMFIFFLVMAFAQPVLNADETGLSNETVSIYLDNSYSMSNQVSGDITAMDDAIDYVQQIINLYPRGTQYRLITNDFAPFSNSYKSAAKVEDHITELKMSSIGRSIDEVLTRLQSLSDAQGIDAEDVYVISDFQRSTFGDISSIDFDSINTFHLIPLQFSQTSNLSVDTVYVKNPFILNRDKIELELVLRNSGDEEVSSANVKVFINDILMSLASVDVAGQSIKTINMDLIFDLKESNQVRITFEEYPVTFDNDFYLNIKPRAKIKVVELKDVLETSLIAKVYANQNLFNISSFHISNINYSEVELANLVVLNQISKLPNPIIQLLKSYLDQGGRLVYIPHSDSEITDINSIFQVSNLSKLVAPDNNEMTSMDKPDLNNPFYSNIFENQQKSFGMPKGHGIFQWTSKVNSLINYSNQNPFLSYFKDQGHFFLFASPLSDDFTDFTKHALFVPVMYKMAMHGADNYSSLYYLLDDSQITITPDTVKVDDIYKLVQAQNEVIPDQRIIGNEVVMQIPKHTLNAGFAHLLYRKDTVQLIAFNSNKAESDLNQNSPSDLFDELGSLSNIKIFESEDAKAFSKEINERYLGVPLWKYALWLALIFLAMEIVIIRFYKQKT